MNKGYSLIEIVVAVALLVGFFSGTLSASQFELKVAMSSIRRERAIYLLEEGLEAARIVRDISWIKNIAPLFSGTTYYPIFNINWKVTSSDPGLIDGRYRRTMVLEGVYRRSSDDDIVDVSSSDPKYLDPDTKKIIVAVTWNESDGTVKQESISTYLTNLFSN